MDAKQLKPFLLHPDKEVRFFVAEYFAESWSQDKDLVPLLLEGAAKYGDAATPFYRASHFPLTHAACQGVVDCLARATDRGTIFHLNTILAHAPVKWLGKYIEAATATARLQMETQQRAARRQQLAEKPGDELWAELKDFAAASQDKQSVSDIDYRYVEDLVEALGRHDVPSGDEICELLAFPELEDGWLDILLVELAGARQLAAAVPPLVEKFLIDADYLLDRTSVALARIGDPAAARLIREAFPAQDWSYRLYTSGFFGRLKCLDSEDAVLALLPGEQDATVRTNLCFSLCKLFSRRGVDVVIREIEEGYDESLVCLEEQLLVLNEVLGLALPQADAWRRQRAEAERLREGRAAELKRLGEAIKAARERPKRRRVSEARTDPDVVQPGPARSQHVGRNDPCPCGSGRKYKKCCGSTKRP